MIRAVIAFPFVLLGTTLSDCGATLGRPATDEWYRSRYIHGWRYWPHVIATMPVMFPLALTGLLLVCFGAIVHIVADTIFSGWEARFPLLAIDPKRDDQ